MNYWIFKVSDRSTYPDKPGQEYVFDNTHSVRVRGGDEFLYLEKTGAKYGLTGAGRVARVAVRRPKPEERHTPRVDRVFTAHLNDVVWLSKSFELSMRVAEGRGNRIAGGLPTDLNSIGWSLSMPRIEPDVFRRLLDAALDAGPPVAVGNVDGRVDDAWSLVRRRVCMQAFRATVLARHDYACLVCGTRLRSVLDVAHIRSYAADPMNRANPANGLCLCRYCHAAFDAGDIALRQDGRIDLLTESRDSIALSHFQAVAPSQRKVFLTAVDVRFLDERCPSTAVDAAPT